MNAVKFSPPDSRITFEVEERATNAGRNIDLIMRNIARSNQRSDRYGHPIIGIPYEYSEQVFDAFYSIEKFQRYLPGERWRDGTGLFVARRLVQRFGGCVDATNGVDYTESEPRGTVRMRIAFPLKR